MENRRGENDEMSKGVWQIVEIKTRKIRMAEAEKKREAKKETKTDVNSAKKHTLIVTEPERKTMSIKRVAKEWKI